MEWRYDHINKEWELVDNGEIFCKLSIRESKKAIKKRFKIKVLIHKMLCGKKKSAELEKKKNIWYCLKEKSFKDNIELEKYIKTKQNELIRYLKNI